MIKASNPVVKDGLGIFARLVVIALLLSILSALLQGCSGSNDAELSKERESVGMQVQETTSTEIAQTVISLMHS